MMMRTFGRLAAGLAVLCVASAAGATDGSTVEAAPPGSPYDYVIHVPNSYDYGYNPTVRLDRARLARRAVRPFCRRSQIVGDDKVITEIWGLTSSPPDYVVYVACRSGRAGK